MDTYTETPWKIVNVARNENGVGMYGYKIRHTDGTEKIISMRTASRLINEKKICFAMFQEGEYLRVSEAYVEDLSDTDLLN